MTPEEALKIDPARYSVHGDVATALRVLQDALREAQAQTVQMREDAARAVMREAANYETAIQKAIGDPAQLDRWSDCRDELAELAAEIRALPAPAARTYEDGVRDAARRVIEAVDACDREAERDPASQSSAPMVRYINAVAALRAALLSPAPAVAPVAAPKPAFDAEAALVAAREAARTGLDLNPTVEARQIAHLLRRMLSDALAAGRGAR